MNIHLSNLCFIHCYIHSVHVFHHSFVNKPVSPVRPNDSLFALATRNDLDLPMANSDALLVDHLSCLLCEHRRLSSQVGDSSPNWQTVWRNGLATIKELHTEVSGDT